MSHAWYHSHTPHNGRWLQGMNCQLSALKGPLMIQMIRQINKEPRRRLINKQDVKSTVAAYTSWEQFKRDGELFGLLQLDASQVKSLEAFGVELIVPWSARAWNPGNATSREYSSKPGGVNRAMWGSSLTMKGLKVAGKQSWWLAWSPKPLLLKPRHNARAHCVWRRSRGLVSPRGGDNVA